MLKYDKFFKMMEARGLRQIDLRNMGVHPRIFQKLANSEMIRSDTIDQLCGLLNCQPADIMEYVPLSDKIQDAQERAQEPAPPTGKDMER